MLTELELSFPNFNEDRTDAKLVDKQSANSRKNVSSHAVSNFAFEI